MRAVPPRQNQRLDLDRRGVVQQPAIAVMDDIGRSGIHMRGDEAYFLRLSFADIGNPLLRVLGQEVGWRNAEPLEEPRIDRAATIHLFEIMTFL